jgi:hypothetical protein
MRRHFLFDPVNGGAGGSINLVNFLSDPKGKASDDQIAAWKAKYPNGIYAYQSNDGLHVGYFKEPSWNEVNCALAISDKNMPLAVQEELCKLTYIGGSDVFLNVDQYKLGICGTMDRKMNGIRGAVANL